MGAILIEQIKDVLGSLGIELYCIVESVQESIECFFIRKKLDLKRGTDLTDYSVTVFCPFEKDGQKMLGSSVLNLHPGMEVEELKEVLQKAYEAAALVCNPYYELNKGTKEEAVLADSTFAGKSLEENTKQMVAALYEADVFEDTFINSAEIFATHTVRHIVNACAVDVSYETYQVSGEYVVQCTTPQDVETYHTFSYRDANVQTLRKEVEEAITITRERAKAQNPPKAGDYTILLSGKHINTLLRYYVERSKTGMVYQKFSNYEIDALVQGQEIQKDALTMYLKAKEPYSAEGIPMKDRLLLQDGTLKTLHGGIRFASYLGVEPTGEYSSIEVMAGSQTVEELKASPYLYIASFSDFQMDEFSGYFGGEIRLAFLYDGKSVTPVTGGSINGSILEAQKHMTFSKELYCCEQYEGPYMVRIENVAVAGLQE